MKSNSRRSSTTTSPVAVQDDVITFVSASNKSNNGDDDIDKTVKLKSEIKSGRRAGNKRDKKAEEQRLNQVADDMSEEDLQKIVKIQSMARGGAVRKRKTVTPVIDQQDNDAHADAKRDYDDEDMDKIVKIQSLGRGKIARNTVAEKRRLDRLGNDLTAQSTARSVRSAAIDRACPGTMGAPHNYEDGVCTECGRGEGSLTAQNTARTTQRTTQNKRSFVIDKMIDESCPGTLGASHNFEDGMCTECGVEETTEQLAARTNLDSPARLAGIDDDDHKQTNNEVSEQKATNSLTDTEDTDITQNKGGKGKIKDLAKYTEEDEKNLIKVQSLTRGNIARKRVAAKKVNGKANKAEKADLAAKDYTDEDISSFTKIQSLTRGKLVRKQLANPKGGNQKQIAGEDMDNLVKIQALARGNLARKKMADNESDQPNEQTSKVYSEEDVKNVIKIQSLARGNFTRKTVVNKKEKIPGLTLTDEDKQYTPRHEYSKEDHKNVVQVQSLARGKFARKQVALKKVARNDKDNRLTGDDLDSLTKVQALARGKLARKFVEPSTESPKGEEADRPESEVSDTGVSEENRGDAGESEEDRGDGAESEEHGGGTDEVSGNDGDKQTDDGAAEAGPDEIRPDKDSLDGQTEETDQDGIEPYDNGDVIGDDGDEQTDDPTTEGDSEAESDPATEGESEVGEGSIIPDE